MHDQFKKRFRATGRNPRLRQQIAAEAARRMFAAIGPTDERGHLRDAAPEAYYAAKRKAAAVLGHRVRPGDLPSDAEVREQVLALARAKGGPPAVEPDAEEGRLEPMADHVDRFSIYRMRLLPLESVKQDPKYHPEGDAQYHSLQVFERAREVRPYDEEFLLAALLHDVGKAIDPDDHVAAGLDALRGTLTERTAWLVEHHMDLLPGRKGAARAREALAASEWFEDLVLLRELDDAGRVPGAPAGTVDEALDYLRGLEAEAYLDD
jgi:hypothetical protein